MHYLKFSVVAVVLVALTPSMTDAQTAGPPAASTFDDLALRLPSRSFVIVTDRQGRRVRGELVRVDRDALTVKTAERALTFRLPEVLEVQQNVPDSFLNGALMGLAIGAAGPLIVCTSIGDSSETLGCVASSLGFGGLSGFAIGAIVDRLRTRKVTVFRSPNGRPAALTLSPLLGPRTIGIQTSVRLSR